jgi:hypothetical protein
MCIQQDDIKQYNLILAKMIKHLSLSESDKDFMYSHELKHKYDSYLILLKIKETFYGSNVSS